MYWSINIKQDEAERCGGRCTIAAKKTDDSELATFLNGAAAAMEALRSMEYGKDEESFLNYVTFIYQAQKLGDDDEC